MIEYKITGHRDMEYKNTQCNMAKVNEKENCEIDWYEAHIMIWYDIMIWGSYYEDMRLILWGYKLGESSQGTPGGEIKLRKIILLSNQIKKYNFAF